MTYPNLKRLGLGPKKIAEILEIDPHNFRRRKDYKKLMHMFESLAAMVPAYPEFKLLGEGDLQSG